MKRNETLDRIRKTGIVPVIRARSGEETRDVIDAIYKGGIDIIELTMVVPGAVELIKELSDRFGEEVVVGAGTVLDAETARACMLAGAKFVVSPSLDLRTVECCNTYGVPVFPGALTPTEILTAWRAGATMVKVFPASAMGGASYIKGLKAPFPQIDLVPTGGVNVSNAADFIAAGAAAVGAGADLVSAAPGEDLTESITKKAQQYIEELKQARMKVRT